MVDVGVPVNHITHLALLVCASGEMLQTDEHTIVVGGVRTDHRAIDRSILTNNEVGAGRSVTCGQDQG